MMSNGKLKIAVDMDDVLVDFTPYVLDCLAREYGVAVDKESLVRFEGLGQVVEAVTGIPGGLFGWLGQRDWLWTKAPALGGAIGGIAQLRAAGHHIELLTKKPDWAEWCVWAWLGKWRPAAHAVTIVPSGSVKADYSAADILVDDSLDNIDRWRATQRVALVFDQPWNRQVPGGGIGWNRCKSWADVLRLVEAMSS